MEGEFIIGAEKDGQSVTIEPGGQFELSGAPVSNLHETYNEVRCHIQLVWSLFFTLHLDSFKQIQDRDTSELT